jgi:hypothetical protein
MRASTISISQPLKSPISLQKTRTVYALRTSYSLEKRLTKMSKNYLLGVVLGLCTLGVQLGAKVNSDFAGPSLTGRYVAGADSMAISVNDLGQVEGFYMRGGAFGEISGKLIDGMVVGSWMEPSGSAACSSKVRDYSSWGPVEASLDSEGYLAVQFGACQKSRVGAARWILHRKE